MKKFIKIAAVGLFLCLIIAVIMNYDTIQKVIENKSLKYTGVILPLTGNASSYGVDCKRGIELFISKNKPEVQFFFEDSKADPRQAVTAIQRLINQKGVSVIIGDMFSSTTLAIAPIAQQNNVVLVTPTAAALEIPQTGDKIFTIYPSSSFEGEFMANQAITLGIKSVGVMVQQVQAAEEIASAFCKILTENNIRIVYIQKFLEGSRDFRSIISAAKTQPTEAIFISAYGQETCSFLQQSKELGLQSLFMSQSTLYDPKLLSEFGDSMENVLFSAPFFTDDSKTPEVSNFRRDYKKLFGQLPTVWAAYGYDVARLVETAINDSETSQDPLHIALKKIRMNGLTGPLSFNYNRTARRSMRLYTVKNGQFIQYPITMQ